MRAQRPWLGLLLIAIATVGCERLAGLGDLADGTHESAPSSAGARGEDEPAGGGGPADVIEAGAGTGGVNTGGTGMNPPEPSGTCTLGVSVLDECVLE